MPYQGTADPTFAAPVGTEFERTDTQERWINVDGATTWIKVVKSTATVSGIDSTAIHDNVASEISAITLKATPVSADMLVIEDSAAANVKKRITIGTLPTGAGSTGTLVQEKRTEHEATESTTLTAYQTSGINTSFTPTVAATFKVEWYAEMTTNSTGKIADMVIEIDTGSGFVTIGEGRVEVSTVASEFFSQPGFSYEALPASLVSYRLRYRLNPNTTGATASIKNKRIDFTRIT